MSVSKQIIDAIDNDKREAKGDPVIDSFDRWMLTRICKKLVIQGPLAQRRMTEYYRIMRKVAREAFIEDTLPSFEGFISECHDDAFNQAADLVKMREGIASEPTDKERELAGALAEAMEWNWLSDKALIEIPDHVIEMCNEALGLDQANDVKGASNGLCNRTACQSPGATWYNHSTLKYYCKSCALDLNHENKYDAQRMFGHELCTPTQKS